MAQIQTTPDHAAMKRIGTRVRARLEADTRAEKLPTDALELYAIADFILPSECERMIAMIDEVAEPSKLYDVGYDTGFRTSYSGNFDPNDPLVMSISSRIDDLLGIDPKNGEPVQGQRYMPGQEFKPHNDWFYTSEKYWQIEKKRGGQRCFTAMAYLNDVEEGGVTEFTNAGIGIPPQKGALLVWNNGTREGQPNEGTMHAGAPVLKGVKYVLTKWYRAGVWG